MLNLVTHLSRFLSLVTTLDSIQTSRFFFRSLVQEGIIEGGTKCSLLNSPESIKAINETSKVDSTLYPPF